MLFSKEEFGKKSEARNRLLADILSRTEYMEKAGTGIRRIRSECNENRNKVHFSFSDSFWIEIKSNQISNDTDRLTAVLNLIINNTNISTVQIAKKLGVSKRTVLRDIEELKKREKIKRIGSERNGYWKLLNEADELI